MVLKINRWMTEDRALAIAMAFATAGILLGAYVRMVIS